MPRQSSDIKELLEWVRLTLVAGDISFRPALSERLEELNLSMVDVLNVLEAPDSVVEGDFSSGCYTFRGRVDDHGMAVVIAERSEKNCVKVIKVWRER